MDSTIRTCTYRVDLIVNKAMCYAAQKLLKAESPPLSLLMQVRLCMQVNVMCEWTYMHSVTSEAHKMTWILLNHRFEKKFNETMYLSNYTQQSMQWTLTSYICLESESKLRAVSHYCLNHTCIHRVCRSCMHNQPARSDSGVRTALTSLQALKVFELSNNLEWRFINA